MTTDARGKFGAQNRGSSVFLSWVICAILIVGIGRFQAIVPVFDAVPVAKLLFFAGVLAVYLGTTRESRNKISNSPLARNLVWFFALSILSVTFSVWKSHSLAFLIGPLFAVIGISWLIYVTGNSESIKKYCTALALCGVLLALTVIVTGSIGPTGRAQLINTYDSNDLAFILDGVIPLMLSRFICRRGATRAFWFGAIAISVWVIMLTESRGGVLGLAAIGTYIAWRGTTSATPLLSSRKRASARVLRLVLLVALSSVVIAYLSSGPGSRLATLANISSDYNVTEPEARIGIWRNAWTLFVKRPWGVGVDAFEAAEGSITGGRYRAAHNMYLQILCELGLVGATLYFRNWWLTWRAVSAASANSSAGRHAEIDRDLVTDLQMIQASIVGILIAGFFLSQAYSLLIYVIFAMAASLTNGERLKQLHCT